MYRHFQPYLAEGQIFLPLKQDEGKGPLRPALPVGTPADYLGIMVK